MLLQVFTVFAAIMGFNGTITIILAIVLCDKIQNEGRVEWQLQKVKPNAIFPRPTLSTVSTVFHHTTWVYIALIDLLVLYGRTDYPICLV